MPCIAPSLFLPLVRSWIPNVITHSARQDELMISTPLESFCISENFLLVARPGLFLLIKLSRFSY